MNIPDDLRYTKEHEWLRVEGDLCVVGITAYAQDQLGDVVYVELPEPGKRLHQFEVFGVVESVKTASDLYVPVSGEVMEVNTALTEHPELVNQSPYDDGWMIKLRPTQLPQELERLLDAKQYADLLAELQKG